MQNETIQCITPPVVEQCELKNLFIQLTKTCNLKCKNCYIKHDLYKNESDYIDIEKIKHTLLQVKNMKLNSIYLTGGEPLNHPDFNQILRMCLKISNTTIMTNGTMINDKKARFLKKIDDESQYETIYRISLDSVNELENDLYRGRGSFRKALSAIFSLIKYEFNPIISVINYENKKREEIFEEFRNYFRQKGFLMDDINLKIIPYYPKEQEYEDIENIQINKKSLDCYNSRIVSSTGVYACPLLVDDYRARLGSNIDDCSKNNYLDCEKCSICAKAPNKAMSNDWM